MCPELSVIWIAPFWPSSSCALSKGQRVHENMLLWCPYSPLSRQESRCPEPQNTLAQPIAWNSFQSLPGLFPRTVLLSKGWSNSVLSPRPEWLPRGSCQDLVDKAWKRGLGNPQDSSCYRTKPGLWRQGGETQAGTFICPFAPGPTNIRDKSAWTWPHQPTLPKPESCQCWKFFPTSSFILDFTEQKPTALWRLHCNHWLGHEQHMSSCLRHHKNLMALPV